jgi:hypothetical protein
MFPSCLQALFRTAASNALWALTLLADPETPVWRVHLAPPVPSALTVSLTACPPPRTAHQACLPQLVLLLQRSALVMLAGVPPVAQVSVCDKCNLQYLRMASTK